MPPLGFCKTQFFSKHAQCISLHLPFKQLDIKAFCTAICKSPFEYFIILRTNILQAINVLAFHHLARPFE